MPIKYKKTDKGYFYEIKSGVTKRISREKYLMKTKKPLTSGEKKWWREYHTLGKVFDPVFYKVYKKEILKN